MNKPTIIARIQFHALVLAPFVLAAIAAAVLFGCQKKDTEHKEAPQPVTIDNLRMAYNKEMNYSVMYARFADRADKDRLKNVAALYRAVAKSEEIHAKDHADLLKEKGQPAPVASVDTPKVGSTIQTIKMAISCEDVEVNQMYPNLCQAADAEKIKEALDQFTHVRDADARQRELLEKASNDLGRFPKADYSVCPGCGYIIDSDKTDECPVCGQKKTTFVKL